MGVEILLADDDCEVRRILAEAFRKSGGHITEASSGDHLLAELRDRAANRSAFDLIVSDIRMPGLTGVEVLRVMLSAEARDDEQPFHETPVILISAFSDDEMRAEAASLGAALFSKPFDIDELLAFAIPLVRPPDPAYCDFGGED
ncbi:MAG TPA: response regulator [Kofleriaceae bacterium]|nr:response regulator [Kofleriaceae bacterium]